MDFSKSQQVILQRLKTRGPQSVKILAKQLQMTTMGVRQHLAELFANNFVSQTQEARQNRGRPVHLWKLTEKGHGHFPDSHTQVSLELIDVIRESYGEASLAELMDRRNTKVEDYYLAELAVCDDLSAKIEKLAALRSAEGYMAEIRLLPDGWLLIENHCPICAVARHCSQFCSTELRLFQHLFVPEAQVERNDHLLAGDRRCAYKITALHPDRAAID